MTCHERDLFQNMTERLRSQQFEVVQTKDFRGTATFYASILEDLRRRTSIESQTARSSLYMKRKRSVACIIDMHTTSRMSEKEEFLLHLEIIGNVTPSEAKAVVERCFPRPHLLYSAYSKITNTAERNALLSTRASEISETASDAIGLVFNPF